MNTMVKVMKFNLLDYFTNADGQVCVYFFIHCANYLYQIVASN